MNWLWVSLPWATFGLGFQQETCREAPPIARWCVGKNKDYLVRYWRRRGAQIEELGQEQP